MTEVVRWWRIDLKDGKVVNCTLVHEAGTDSTDVVFVRGDTEDEAKEAGRHAWNAFMRERQRKRRKGLVDAGLCPRGPHQSDRGPGKTCSKCLEQQIVYDDRKRKKARGEKVAPLDKAAAFQRNRESMLDEHRLSVLREVNRHWLSTQGNRAIFSAWLVSEIEKLSKKAVA